MTQCIPTLRSYLYNTAISGGTLHIVMNIEHAEYVINNLSIFDESTAKRINDELRKFMHTNPVQTVFDEDKYEYKLQNKADNKELVIPCLKLSPSITPTSFSPLAFAKSLPSFVTNSPNATTPYSTPSHNSRPNSSSSHHSRHSHHHHHSHPHHHSHRHHHSHSRCYNIILQPVRHHHHHRHDRCVQLLQPTDNNQNCSSPDSTSTSSLNHTRTEQPQLQTALNSPALVTIPPNPPHQLSLQTQSKSASSLPKPPLALPPPPLSLPPPPLSLPPPPPYLPQPHSILPPPPSLLPSPPTTFPSTKH